MRNLWPTFDPLLGDVMFNAGAAFELEGCFVEKKEEKGVTSSSSMLVLDSVEGKE